MQHMRSFVECRTCELTNKSLGFDGPIVSDVQFLYAGFQCEAGVRFGDMVGHDDRV